MLHRHGKKIIIVPDKKRAKVIRIAVIGTAALLLAAFAVYFFAFRKTSWVPSAEKTATVIPSPTATLPLIPNPTMTAVTATNKPTVSPTPMSVITENPHEFDAAVPESALVTDQYFKDAVIIGDSRTEGFMLFSGLKDSTFFALKGLSVSSAFTNQFIKGEGDQKLTVVEALKKKSYAKVYIMLGINELGWSYSSAFVDKYSTLIDEIKKSQPNAVIYVQSILPVTAERSESDKIYNNAKIMEYNKLILQMTKEKKVHYVNVAEAVKDGTGALYADASTDGIHLTKKYCEIWLNYLKNHTITLQ